MRRFLPGMLEVFNMTSSLSGQSEHTGEDVLRRRHRPGDLVPESGVYRVTHDAHRLMHEATLLVGDRFPLCRQCKHAVRFEMLRTVKDPNKITTGHHAILEDYPDSEPSPIM